MLFLSSLLITIRNSNQNFNTKSIGIKHHEDKSENIITIESLASAVMSQECKNCGKYGHLRNHMKTHMGSSNTHLTGTVDLTDDKISTLENMEHTWHSQIKIITFTFYLLLFHTDKLEDHEAPGCRPVHSTQYTVHSWLHTV